MENEQKPSNNSCVINTNFDAGFDPNQNYPADYGMHANPNAHERPNRIRWYDVLFIIAIVVLILAGIALAIHFLWALIRYALYA